MIERPRLVSIGKIPVIPFAQTGSVYATYRALAAHCERIDYIGLADGPEARDEVDGVIHLHGAPNLPGLGGHLAFLSYARRRADRLAKEIGTDVYWLSDPLDSALVGHYAGWRWKVPVVLHVQADMFALSRQRFSPRQRWLMARLTEWAANRATRVRVVSQHIADGVVAAGIAREKLVVIPPRTDLAIFRPADHRDAAPAVRAGWGFGDDACVVLHVGAFNASKGIDLLLTAAAELRTEAPHLRYVLIGDGELREAMEAQVRASGIEELVRFEGFVPYERLPVYYAATDAGVVSSTDEGIGRGGIQAAAMERPVIMTDVGGNREVLTEGITGWLIRPTAAGLAEGLRKLAARTPEERRTMGLEGRQRLAPLFEFNANIACQVAQLLRFPTSPSRREE